MSEIITISNESISVSISTRGAELKSIVVDGKERLWGGNPDVWYGQAPLLFPVCGGLRDNKYVYDGKEYTLEKHGYARTSEFEAETTEKEKAVFLLCSNEESRKKYPFDYELRVIYTLEGKSLRVDYEVKNLTDGDMYFSIGAHEGYDCPEGIENYTVVFEREEELDSNILNGNLLEHKTINLGRKTKELPLKYDYFAVDAQVFLNLKSRKVSLRNNETNETVSVKFDGFDYFLLWTKPNGNYICLEPWCCFQDFVDSNYDITEKPGMIKLGKNEISKKTHSIVF